MIIYDNDGNTLFANTLLITTGALYNSSSVIQKISESFDDKDANAIISFNSQMFKNKPIDNKDGTGDNITDLEIMTKKERNHFLN